MKTTNSILTIGVIVLLLTAGCTSTCTDTCPVPAVTTLPTPFISHPAETPTVMTPIPTQTTDASQGWSFEEGRESKQTNVGYYALQPEGHCAISQNGTCVGNYGGATLDEYNKAVAANRVG